jgi:uncharacterized protein (DUF488 family)
MVKIYTIGFTKKSAERFFEILQDSGSKRLVDIRLNNASQLSGFTKRDDLRYFLHELCDMDYVHEQLLAPTKEMLDEYKKYGLSWPEYEQQFLQLVAERQIESTVSRDLIANSVLLCSETTAHQCHRRLVAEYLAEQWGDLEIVHL